jgi:hypothetical protein
MLLRLAFHSMGDTVAGIDGNIPLTSMVRFTV